MRIAEKFPPSVGAYLITCSPNAAGLSFRPPQLILQALSGGDGIYVVGLVGLMLVRVQVDSTR